MYHYSRANFALLESLYVFLVSKSQKIWIEKSICKTKKTIFEDICEISRVDDYRVTQKQYKQNADILLFFSCLQITVIVLEHSDLGYLRHNVQTTIMIYH